MLVRGQKPVCILLIDHSKELRNFTDSDEVVTTSHMDRAQ